MPVALNNAGVFGGHIPALLGAPHGIYCIAILLAMKKLQIDKAGDKVLLSDNYQVNRTVKRLRKGSNTGAFSLNITCRVLCL